MNIGKQMNYFYQKRKHLGNAGYFFDTDPFQTNPYDTFQTKHKKQKKENIKLLTNKNKQTKKEKQTKKVTLEAKSSLQKILSNENITIQNKPNETIQDLSIDTMNTDNDVKVIHVTNLLPEKDKEDIVI